MLTALTGCATGWQGPVLEDTGADVLSRVPQGLAAPTQGGRGRYQVVRRDRVASAV